MSRGTVMPEDDYGTPPPPVGGRSGAVTAVAVVNYILGALSLICGVVAIVAAQVLALFHAGHRFRFTLYDGLQIKHLNELIALLCYGGAVVGSAFAAYLLWQVP